LRTYMRIRTRIERLSEQIIESGREEWIDKRDKLEIRTQIVNIEMKYKETMWDRV